MFVYGNVFDGVHSISISETKLKLVECIVISHQLFNLFLNTKENIFAKELTIVIPL